MHLAKRRATALPTTLVLAAFLAATMTGCPNVFKAGTAPVTDSQKLAYADSQVDALQLDLVTALNLDRIGSEDGRKVADALSGVGIALDAAYPIAARGGDVTDYLEQIRTGLGFARAVLKAKGVIE